MSEPFCSRILRQPDPPSRRARLRQSELPRTCLLAPPPLRETDLREPLARGASDDELETIIRDAVWRKELKHRWLGEPGFTQPARTMSAIGG